MRHIRVIISGVYEISICASYSQNQYILRVYIYALLLAFSEGTAWHSSSSFESQ